MPRAKTATSTPKEEPESQSQPQSQPEIEATQAEPESQVLPAPAEPQRAPEQLPRQEGESPFNDMMKREYEHAMDLEIKKAVDKINRRATMLMAQESSITDVITDALGHDSDWYEDLALAVSSNDPRVGQTREDVYNYLQDLAFTEMKNLDTLKAMYPVGEQS